MFESDFEISNLQPNWKLNLNFAPVCLTNMYDTILDGYEHSPARENGGQQSLSPITIMMVALIRLSEKICRTPRSRTHNSCCNRRWGRFSLHISMKLHKNNAAWETQNPLKLKEFLLLYYVGFFYKMSLMPGSFLINSIPFPSVTQEAGNNERSLALCQPIPLPGSSCIGWNKLRLCAWDGWMDGWIHPPLPLPSSSGCSSL